MAVFLIPDYCRFIVLLQKRGSSRIGLFLLTSLSLLTENTIIILNSEQVYEWRICKSICIPVSIRVMVRRKDVEVNAFLTFLLLKLYKVYQFLLVLGVDAVSEDDGHD